MRREDLAHILRSASAIADDPEILVIGSQAILASYHEDELPEAAWMSREADIAFLNDVLEGKANQVDGAIGELSEFDAMYSYYAQGVSVSTAILPDGWRDRLVPFQAQGAHPAAALCLEPHDLVISKLVAMRQKDRNFSEALIVHHLIDCELLLERVELLAMATPLQRRRVKEWIVSAQNRLDRTD